jgi:hypothetical protein
MRNKDKLAEQVNSGEKQKNWKRREKTTRKNRK